MTVARGVVAAVTAAVLIVAASIGGVVALAYLVVYIAATLPGWPIGFALFGRRHAAGWIAGALLGYAITALALWIPIVVGMPGVLAFVLAWTVVTVAAWTLYHFVRAPAVDLPGWTPRDTVGLCSVVVLVPLLVALPYGRIGESDAQGNRRYRAYFTADFVWHEALTAELARFSSPPRNPYLAGRSLHYYWAYFLLPAAVTGTGPSRMHSPPIETYLAANGFYTGLLFVAAIYMAAWSALPRAPIAVGASSLALLASSAEGLYATIDLLKRGRPLAGLRTLNIDAITAWYVHGLTIDGLPRSVWYNPQHSLACALGLVALTVAGRSPVPMKPTAAIGAGLALGLALTISPFPGGAMTLIYGLVVLWTAAVTPRLLPRAIGAQFLAVVPVVAALAWCVFNKTFEGAGSAIVFGLSAGARTSPLLVMALALGPVLVFVIAGGFAAAAAAFPPELRPATVGVAVSLALLFFVTLSVEPIWIGWRAGQVLLVTCPGLAALAIATLDRLAGRVVAVLVVTTTALIGLPTTVIDHYNAQDTSNVEMGAGFRWTVVVSPGEQAALRWIELNTPADALVQMALTPRGRETWSLIPSFARRRMAAGLPISLLRSPDYDERASRADAMFAATDPDEAWRLAHALRIDYVYAGRVERETFGHPLRAFDARPDLFAPVFANAEASVYQVR
jgi:hypothetical protein